MSDISQQVEDECTLEWLEVYEKAVADGENFAESFWWRAAATNLLPLGVNEDDPRVIAAIADIRKRLKIQE